MTEKRYFERKWEGEYYIFDSQTISEKEFDEKVQYEDYQAFADSMTGEEVTDRLNKYNKAYLDCHNDVLRLEKENEQLKDENKELKHENVKIMSDLDYFRAKSGSCEEGLFQKDKEIAKLEKENKKLKRENGELQQELFESEQECLEIDYYDNPIRRDNKIEMLKEEFKERFGRDFE